MKKLTVFWVFMFIASVFFVETALSKDVQKFGKGKAGCPYAGGGTTGVATTGGCGWIGNLPYEEVSDVEKAALLYVREKEKLARDIYNAFYETWNYRIFYNIPKSEEMHIKAVLSLLEKYNISDTITNDVPGTFTNPDLAKLYEELLKKGNESFIEALKVGAKIEELSISDLKKNIEETDNTDIKFIFGNLMKGSINHLKAFSFWIKAQGGTYEPSYLSNEEMNDFLTTSNKTAVGCGRGKRALCGQNCTFFNGNGSNTPSCGNSCVFQKTESVNENEDK
ncbi:MAG: DUF2202 domain-containing protein [Desulfobacterales bacterium]|nr:DUF2202 domain-containing protein [Desulfobacterales bacterium]